MTAVRLHVTRHAHKNSHLFAVHGGRDDVKIRRFDKRDGLQAFNDKLKQRFQVVGCRRGDENVAVPVPNGARDGKAKGRRLAPPTRGGDGDGGAQRLVSNGVGARQDGGGLVQRRRHSDERAQKLRGPHAFLDFAQLQLFFRHQLVRKRAVFTGGNLCGHVEWVKQCGEERRGGSG